MRGRLLVNPASGNDRGALLLPLINARLRTVLDDLDVTLTIDEHDVERGAQRAAADGCDALYVAGGDGTINAAVRGLLASGHDPLTLPIGVIPVGTGNDFAKSLGLGDVAETAIEGLLEWRTIAADVGFLNDQPFINVSAGGFVAEVSERTTEGLKDVVGRLAYIVGGARALAETQPFTATVRVAAAGDQQPPTAAKTFDIRMFAVCNARLIGGGYPIAPRAMIDDGLLDVLIVPAMSLLDFGGVLQGIAAGEPDRVAGVEHFRTPAFDLEFSRSVRVNRDGEVLEARSCRYRIRERALRFFCGAEPHANAQPTVDGR